MITGQMTMERPAAVAVTDSAHSSILKSILVQIQDDATLEQRLEAALSLARPTSAHVSCIHVTPVNAYVAFDTFGGIFVMDRVMEAVDEQAASLKARIEGKLNGEDVSWDYEEVTADAPSAVVSRAAFADLVVTGREPRRQGLAGSSIGVLGDVLTRCRSPLFIPGDGAPAVDPTGVAVIAWDGSYEAANAVRASIGLLKLASSVVVLQVAEKKDERFPGTRMLEYLSRHGIEAELVVQDPPGGYSDNEAIAAMLVSYAKQAKASYLVLGGYSHSRAGEFVFGGVTRTLLKECPVALVIAH